MSVIDEIAAERLRQIEVEGFSPERDDVVHERGQLAKAAACYALRAGQFSEFQRGAHLSTLETEGVFRFAPPPYIDWPWSGAWWKPKSRRSALIRAAALVVAEIERLDRAATVTDAATAEERDG